MKDTTLTNIDEIIDLSIAEDIGDGDHSSLACIPDSALGKMKLIAKENGIIAGIDLAKHIYKRFDSDIEMEIYFTDGTEIKPGDKIFEVKGKVQSLLKAERLVLNFMQRMSGIATATQVYVKELDGLNTQILDTRKTTPCMRQIEKLAVKLGGGTNHRFGLYDMIMLKDNHVDFAGGITQAVNKTKEYLKKNNKDLKIELEVRDFNELNEALNCTGIDVIMLDNFSVSDTKKAVDLVNKRVKLESSGGITIDTIRNYAECGVDFISVGALTHHIKSLDLSLLAD